MPGRRPTALATEASRRNREQLARLGGEIRKERRRRVLTHADLGERVGVGRMTIGRMEGGRGGRATLDAWQRIALGLGRHLIVGLQRAMDEEPADAGHLAIQELVLRHARAAGFGTRGELPTRPAESWRSADVVLIDDVGRRLLIVECWNTIGDVGAAMRSSERKRADAERLAAARWGEAGGVVGLVWVVRSVARNRALVARYPEVFASRFPGSSALWLRALTTGSTIPREPGLVWAGPSGDRLWAWRVLSGAAERHLT